MLPNMHTCCWSDQPVPPLTVVASATVLPAAHRAQLTCALLAPGAIWVHNISEETKLLSRVVVTVLLLTALALTAPCARATGHLG